MDVNEFFGSMPNRPDHPDFWKLVAVVMKLDSGIDVANQSEEENEEVWRAKITEVGIDSTSLIYMAHQRAMLALGITTVGQMLARLEEVTLMTTVWVDSFCAGAMFTKGAV